MKNRRQATNGNFKFKGTLEKFNALLDVVELNRHEFLSEKKSYGLEDLIDDQLPRKKRSLRQQPKKKIIAAEALQNRELVLLGTDLDWVVMVVKEKEILQSQAEEKSSSRLEGEKSKKQPIIDDQPPRKKRSLRQQPKKRIIDAEVLQNRELVLPGSDVDWVVMVVKEKEMIQIQTQEKSSGEAVRLRPEIPDLNLPADEISSLNLPPSQSEADDMMIDKCD